MLPIFSQSPIVEERPEQIQAKAAVAHVDIAPCSVPRIVDGREANSIPKANTESYWALISDAGRGPQFCIVGDILYALVFPGRRADIQTDFGPGLNVKSTREPQFGHQGDADVTQIEIIVDRHGSIVAGGSRFDPGAFRRIQYFRSNGEMISQPEINKDTRIPARERGKGRLVGITFRKEITQVSSSLDSQLKGLRGKLTSRQDQNGQ